MSIADKIQTYSDWNRLEPYYAYIARFAGMQLPEIKDFLDPVVQAYINHGRWVGECPNGCGAALMVEPDLPVFFCIECKDGWREVKFPDNRSEIEKELLKRPLVAHTPITRNWRPYESLSDLQAQNLKHGVH